MSLKINAINTIARRKIFETFISPAFYIAVSIGFLLTCFLVKGFTGSIDSSGLNYTLNPMYEMIYKSLSGAFGDTFVINLFAEGPYNFSLFIAFVPFILYLSISSVYKFGLEKTSGWLELVTCGPSDGTSYFLASLVRNVFFTVLYALLLILFDWFTSLVSNVVLHPSFFTALAILCFLSLAVYAVGTLASVITNNASASTALFIGLLVFFILIEISSFSIISGYVRSFSAVLSWIIKWFSPVFYWHMGLSAIGFGNLLLYLVNILMLIVVTVMVLLLSHFILKSKGVRV
ncbi:MAG: hypothetical protein AB1798_03310 [Spirochaetota bacterium]